MWNEPSTEQLAKLPRLYETEEVPLRDKVLHLHLFIGGCDWYVAEYDGEDTFFCFVILNGDTDNAEWGCTSFGELKELSLHGRFEIDCDLHWRVRPAREVEKIRQCGKLWLEPEPAP